ncbi:MAG: DODA-type extradiol aromatic ring-opening family dioxygenase, partial [Sphingopyxis sp.]
MPRPRAILLISAHHDGAAQGGRITITASPNPPTIHDFGGFPAELFAMQYPAPGAPDVARTVAQRLMNAGFDAQLDGQRGLDHGAWVPLSLMVPGADVPVVQLSIATGQSPQWHYELGQILAPLRDDGIMIVGSGGITHNLRAFAQLRPAIDAPPPDWVVAFTQWLAQTIAAQDVDGALQAVATGPHGRDNHPTMDHILPLFVAMGAGDFGPGRGRGVRLHHSYTYAILAMDVYAFG